jgi:hypothetical protein
MAGWPAMGRAQAAEVIEAPIELVWEVVLDTERYPEWNPFVVRIDRPRHRQIEVGDPVVLHVRWHTGGRTTSAERVTQMEGPEQHGGRRAVLEYQYRGAFSGPGLVRGRRRQELARLADDATSYSTFEHLRGALAWAAPITKVRDGFERHAAALKARAEALYRGEV